MLRKKTTHPIPVLNLFGGFSARWAIPKIGVDWVATLKIMRGGEGLGSGR